jgi:hypothetical protein
MNGSIQQPYSPYARGCEFSPIVRVVKKIKRNQVCPINNTKFKKCCGKTGQNFCNKSIDSLNEYLKCLDKKDTDNDKIS